MEIELQLCNNTLSLAALELPLHHTESGVSSSAAAAAAPISLWNTSCIKGFQNICRLFYILFVLFSCIWRIRQWRFYPAFCLEEVPEGKRSRDASVNRSKTKRCLQTLKSNANKLDINCWVIIRIIGQSDTTRGGASCSAGADIKLQGAKP